MNPPRTGESRTRAGAPMGARAEQFLLWYSTCPARWCLLTANRPPSPPGPLSALRTTGHAAQ